MYDLYLVRVHFYYAVGMLMEYFMGWDTYFARRVGTASNLYNVIIMILYMYSIYIHACSILYVLELVHIKQFDAAAIKHTVTTQYG